MRPDLARQALAAVRREHASGHTCTDGKWWNPRTGTRSPCPTLTHLDTADRVLAALGTQVHAAAHQPRHVDAVATAMTSTPLGEMSPENAEAWRGLARQAIEALSYSLDTSDALTERAATAAARV